MLFDLLLDIARHLILGNFPFFKVLPKTDNVEV